jgi:hypothetical protein
MADMTTRIQNLATRIATECKSIRTLLNGNTADLSSLTTTAKGNLVLAINELKQELQALGASGGATINDASIASTTQTYSITKIRDELTATAQAVKDEILDGAGAAYDTLAELQALLQGDATEIAALNTAIGNRVRFDVNTQNLNATQRQNARTNIDAYGSVEIGNPDTDFVATFTAGLS